MTNPWDPLVDRMRKKIKDYHARGLRIFASSSFQSHSIPMLHILSTIDPDIPVYFLDTGFHFPETKVYRDEVGSQLGIQIISLESTMPKIAQRDQSGQFLFTSDPDRCCYINKVLPLEPVLKSHDIWISGVRRDQTQFRSDLAEETSGIHDTLRYHPMLDWNSKMIWNYRQQYNLPEHPLDAKGYLSIGCVPCTRKWSPEDDERGARWAGMTKEECGIHTEFVEK
jgi:phosphoadenosine phosphosulfate reductase